MSLINEPIPLAFVDNLLLPTTENIMNPVQRYWYNKGHEDGRKLATVKELTLTDEEIEQIASQYLTAHAQFIGAGEVTYDGEIEFAKAILRKAQEK